MAYREQARRVGICNYFRNVYINTNAKLTVFYFLTGRQFYYDPEKLRKIQAAFSTPCVLREKGKVVDLQTIREYQNSVVQDAKNKRQKGRHKPHIHPV